MSGWSQTAVKRPYYLTTSKMSCRWLVLPITVGYCKLSIGIGPESQGESLPRPKQTARRLFDGNRSSSVSRFFLFIFGLFLAFLAGTQISRAAEVAHRYITIGTGNPTGAYYSVGTAICDAINRQSNQRVKAGATLVTKCLVAFSGGSVFNIRQVGNGAFTFVIAQSNVAQLALDPTPADTVASVRGLRSVMALHNEALHVVAQSNTLLNEFSDLQGALISTGGIGSGSRQLFLRAAEAHGLFDGAFDQVDNMSPDIKVRSVCDGLLSAFVVVTAVPSQTTAKAASECGAQLLPLDSEAIAEMFGSSPSLEAVQISDDAYPGMTATVQTIGVRAGLFTRDVVPDAVVRDVVEAVLGNLDLVRAAHPALADLSPDLLHPTRLGVPVHIAAEKSFTAKDLN